MDEEQGTITTSSSNADRQSLMNDGNGNGNGNGNDDDDDDEVVTTQQQQQQQQQQHYDDDEKDENEAASASLLIEKDHHRLYLFGKYPLLDNNNNNNPNTNGFIIKLLKFIFVTYIMIGLIHVIVSQLFEDRDQLLKLKYILLYESDLIVRDCVIFFLVGRLYKKSSTGIDTIMFLSTVLFSNLYFESQNFIYFLQHSVSLYEIHCIWPWELWLFVLLLVPTIGTIVGLHVLKGYRENTLSIKITEMILCLLFFVAPMITSNYFHLHHWYAGWLLGMHCNYNTWWSKMSMAWCWGMYINGIAVYGRDPVLTCEYAYFLTIDNQCPYISCYLDAIQDVNQTDIKEMVPVDWRNCSAASSSGDYMP
ncbi:hypothetical protein FRACYDRAFT_231805 [Fragilariopsis cylindrus CCMP1102]|uniref:Uncharacterized protein n=1 Tax=Fragilariopsis cylindrus CCMP1102 TaxID=635003 RepID=A0A1E7FU62_9STRA|nr:hypothetical protein FRACYDRAFT_231805 [Fragilariopsis cylindrus CCMP1102]|eukprot:OEU21664.1 hypothetical protein FRACYDRAFT_231805 [Fragilariopsis cylindrus CCMP1102]